jgi:hypothetical protein
MTNKRGPITFRRGVDRLFEQVDQFTIHNTMFFIGALWASKALGRGIDHDDVATIDSFAFALSVDIPLGGVAEAAFQERQADERTIVVQAGRKGPTMPDHLPFSRGLNSVLWFPSTSIFVEFFERVKPWMQQNYPSQKLWPPTIYFARLIRNAVSHGGRLHITHDPGRDAEWHHLKFGRSDDGKQAIGPGGFLSPADMLLLMIDTGDELDRIGCPV